MGRNKGTLKTGGRAKGTANKTTTDVRKWLQSLIDDNRGQFEKDLKSLDAKGRVTVIERLMQYVMPKQTAISVEAQIQTEYEELRKLLGISPDEVIERLVERINNINNLNNNG
jgi:hypothetical protein